MLGMECVPKAFCILRHSFHLKISSFSCSLEGETMSETLRRRAIGERARGLLGTEQPCGGLETRAAEMHVFTRAGGGITGEPDVEILLSMGK